MGWGLRLGLGLRLVRLALGLGFRLGSLPQRAWHLPGALPSAPAQ